MGCKKKTTQILKRVAQGLKPVLVKHAVNMVGIVQKASTADPSFWTNDTKRRAVFSSVKAEAQGLGLDLPNRTFMLLVEYAVEAVKGPDDESDLGADDTAEAVSV